MKCFKIYIPVDNLVDKLSDEDKTQVKCAYISNAEFDDNGVDITVVIDEDDDTDEFCDITKNWFDPEEVLNDEYLNYLMDNCSFENEGIHIGCIYYGENENKSKNENKNENEIKCGFGGYGFDRN